MNVVRAAVIAAVLLVVVAVVGGDSHGSAVALAAANPQQVGVGPAGGVNGHDPFVASGDVTGLIPGRGRPFVVTVRNAEAFPILVQSLSATIKAVDALHPGCPPTIGGSPIVVV